MRIRPEDIEQVRAAANLSDIVARYVHLRPAGGGRLKGLCPFHDEKTPSFTVSADRGVYHCFGCQAGGDAIDFIQNVAGVGFIEAVETLATLTGIHLHYDDAHTAPRGPSGSSRQRCAAANAAAADYYRAQLDSPEASRAIALLNRRHLDGTQAAAFAVGYAPNGWDRLTRLLRSRGYTDKELLEAGLARNGSRGLIDAFRDRLIWPITDLTGVIVGFGARRLDDSDATVPKYLNTAETALYRKSRTFYGLNLARVHVQAARNVRIVEGYTDVMACHLAGAPNTIATCGTSLTDEHLALLVRLLGDDGTITLCFDPDGAGANATLRLLAGHPTLAARTLVTELPDGRDPADLRQARGDAALLEALEHTTSLITFAVNRTLRNADSSTPEGQAVAARRVAAVLSVVSDPVLRAQHLHAVSTQLRVPVEVLAGTLPPLGHEATAAPRSASPTDRIDGPAREAIKIALACPKLPAALAAAALVNDPRYAGIAKALQDAARTPDPPAGASWVSAVRAACTNDADQQLTAALAVEPLAITEDLAPARYAEALLERLSGDQPAAGDDIESLRRQLRTAPSDQRPAVRKRLAAALLTTNKASPEG